MNIHDLWEKDHNLRYHVRAYSRDDFNKWIEITFFVLDVDEGKMYYYDAHLEERPHHAELQLPPMATAAIPREVAQILMDDLWLAGLRPSEGNMTVGFMETLKDSVRDARMIRDTVLMNFLELVKKK